MNITIVFNKFIGQGLSCWSEIPWELPTISQILVIFHQDFVASIHSNFFQGQTGRGCSIGLTMPRSLCCPSMKKKSAFDKFYTVIVFTSW